VYRREDIDKVRAATNLIDLAAAVTTVKRQGRSHVAVCPFHQEKTPSLSLDPARGLYHCFGCGKGGDVFTFIQETQGLDFNESVEFLARQVGVHLEVDPGAAKRRGEHEELIEAVRHAVAFYQRILKNAPEAGIARGYLRGRGIDADIVDAYRIGFAPESETWGALVKEMRAAGVKDRTMEAAGLVRRGRGGRIYDTFRSRILFPIYDLRGDPVGFGGRALGTETPKYLNSPDSRIYQKSRLLYGLDRAKRVISRTGEAVVVEGYFDVIACHRAGLDNAVATCGTALGEEHFDLLRRFTDRVVLAFDSDEAGSGAALRGAELRTPVDLDFDLRVAEMPGGMDPADLIQADRGSELAKAIAGSRPLLQFRIEKEVASHNLTEPEGRARALRRVAPLLSRVDDPIAQAEYVRFAARLLGVEAATVERALSSRSRRTMQAVKASEAEAIDPVQLELLRVVLANPAALHEVEIPLEWFSEGPARTAFLHVAPRRHEAQPGTPLDLADLNQDPLIQRLALDPRPLPKDPIEVVGRARVKWLEAEIDELQQQLLALDPSTQVYSDVLRRLIGLERERRT
jgi:DNA primase